MKRAPIERTNAELPVGDRPPPASDSGPRLEPEHGYWLGSAGSEVEYWKARALRAEQALFAMACER